MGRLSDYVNGMAARRGGGASAGSGGGFNMNVEINEWARQAAAEKLGRLMVTSPGTRRALRKAIGNVLRRTRNKIAKDVKSGLNSDPRQAYKAVKSSLYKQILGGNVSILNPRKAGLNLPYNKRRKLDANPNQRGGNRRTRSDRTEQVDGYWGKDRAFILRFVNSGTEDRLTRFGNRGSIRARRMFEISATYQMQAAAEEIGRLIDVVIADEAEKGE